MTRKLGALLIGEGLITNEQLDEALRIQSLYGGRIGSNLVEMGYLDVDVLADRLAHITGFQCATTAMLAESPYDTTRMISAELAEKFEAIPFRREARRLFVAMVNPTDLAASDELRFKTGLQIVPHVAPEILIRTFLEKNYGVKIQVKAIQLAPKKLATPAIPAGIRRETPPSTSTPPAGPLSRPPKAPATIPPRAGQPSRSGTPLASIPLATPSPAWVKQAGSPPSGTVQTGPRVTTNPGGGGASRGSPANAVEPPTLPPAGVSKPPADTWPPNGGPTTIPPAAVTQPPPEVTAAPGSRPSLTARMSLAQVDAALAEAHDRDDLAETVLRFAAGRLDATVILLVRDGQVVGWKGQGPGLDETRVEGLQMPLAESPILVEAVEQRQPAGGSPSEERLAAAFYEKLQLRQPESVMIVPVVLRNRTVNLIYGDRSNRADALDAADPFLELAEQVSVAYERIFRESRRKR